MRIRFLLIFGLGALLACAAPAAAESPIGHMMTKRARSAEAAERSAQPKEKVKLVKAGKTGRKAAKATRTLPPPVEEASFGNNGELRSEQAIQPNLFSMLFGGPKQNLLPETRKLDSILEEKQSRHKFTIKPAFQPQTVPYSGYARGTIVIDTAQKYLYLVESSSSARRYAIAVGREGLAFKGKATVGDKQEWPRWIPTKEMQEREPKKYGQYKDGMPGGPANPLGARAIYLYQGRLDTHVRIHGTNQPQTIGTASSNGCFRMFNEQVMDLYRRVRIGTPVVVL